MKSSLEQAASLNKSLRQLKAKERQLVVESPADGIIIDLPARENQVLAPGAPLVSVALPGRLEVKADILSDDLGDVKTGQQVLVTAPVLGEKSLAGEVMQIYPRAEEKLSALGVIQRRVPVIIALPDPANLKPGYEVRVAIETSTRKNVLLAPRESVRTRPDGQKEVMVVANNRVRYRLVQTGLSDGENIEITGGLDQGEVIVKDAGMELKHNARIKILD